MCPVPSFLRGCSILPCGLRALFTSPVFWVDPGLGRAGLLALPPTLPAAPTPAVQNPHREGSDLSGIARSQIDFTLISEKRHFLYSRTFLRVYIFFCALCKIFVWIVRERREEEGEISMWERSIDEFPPGRAYRRGSNPQPTFVPCPRIKPATFWRMGHCCN